MDDGTAYITIKGLAPDIVGLSKLFPMGTGDLQVKEPSEVVITPEANGFRVDKSDTITTKVTGPLVVTWLQKLSGDRFKQDGLNAISQMLNAAGLVCDPEFRPVTGTSWGIVKPGGFSGGVPEDPNASYRKRTSHGRVAQHVDMAKRVAEAVNTNETARRIFWILQDPNPGWVGYNMILEEIAFHEGVAVSQLEGIKIAPPGFISAFKNAANNARDLNQKTRHGKNLNSKPNKSKIVSLWQAMSTVREIVHHWVFALEDSDSEN